MLVAGAVALAFASPAHATGRTTGDGPALELWSIELGAAQVHTASAPFDGSGHYADGSQGRFTGTGRQIGALSPWFVTYGVHPMAMVTRHVALGVLFEMGSGGADGPRDAYATQARISSSLSFLRVGGDLTTVWGAGPFELRVGVGAGARVVSAPILSFEPTPCKGGRCYPTASEAQLYVQPRVSVSYVASRMFTAGVYAGVDVLPDFGFSAGAFLAVHLPSWSRDSQVGAPSVEPPAPTREAARPMTPLVPEVPLQGMLTGPLPDVPRVIVQYPQDPSFESVPVGPAPLVVPWRVHADVDPTGRTITVTTPDGTVVLPVEPR